MDELRGPERKSRIQTMSPRRILVGQSRGLAIALLCTGASLAVHLALRHFLGPLPPFLTFYPAVLLATLLGGITAGVVTCGLSLLAVDEVLLPANPHLVITHAANHVAIVVFVTTCSIASWLVADRDRRVRKAAAAAHEEAAAAQKKLATANSRISTVFDNLDEGVLFMDVRGAGVLANAAVERILGVNAEAFADPALDPRLHTLSDQGCPLALSDMPSSRVIATGHAVNNVLLNMPDAAGRRHWLRVNARPLFSDSGSLEGAVTSFSDVTAIKQADDEVQASRDRLELVVRNAPFGLAMFDRNMRYLRVSKRYLEDYGLAQEDVLGRCHYDIFPEIPLVWRSVHQRALDGEQVSNEGEAFLRADGGMQYIRWQILPWYETTGAIGGVILFTENITAQRDAQLALEQAEERFRKAFLLSPLPMAIGTYPDGRYLDANEALLKVMGRTRDEVIGHLSTEFGFWVDPSQRATLVADIQVHGLISGYHFKFRRGDGEIRDGEMTAQRMELGGQVCLVTITRDITEELRVEAQLLQTHKMEAVERLAGGLAHDFNNLLGVISTATDLAAADPSHLPRHLGHIRAAATRASELTGQLLALSNHDMVFPRRFDLNDLLASLRDRLRDSSGCRCHIAFSSDLKGPIVHADPTLIERSLTILATKACERSGNGGVSIRLSLAGSIPQGLAAQRSVNTQATFYRIAVSDSGPGMIPEQIQKIFDPFHSDRPDVNTDGLGYAVAQGIAAQSGGFIEASSEPGQGTTFTFYLPALVPQTLTPVSAFSGTPQDGGEHSAQPVVLVVEDNAPLRELTLEMLADAGFQTLEAESAEAAMDLIARDKPRIDLLLTDVIMPGRNGLQLHGDVAASYPSAKVLFMSGYPSDVLSSRTGAATEETFLQKPFNRSKLLAKVNALLKHNADSKRESGVRGSATLN